MGSAKPVFAHLRLVNELLKVRIDFRQSAYSVSKDSHVRHQYNDWIPSVGVQNVLFLKLFCKYGLAKPNRDRIMTT
ncbi:hypothetical protein FGADI_12573 [Fusarium gaditjirri]|uniref:Uncharacterized protein n=1 Tax=Fusarium gaditjirri TaxID=282569 RepID=A0A8H4SSG0_9HYPO|nr:hypothetical protein FGADI_12573 [Fusarium gaditjirri]